MEDFNTSKIEFENESLNELVRNLQLCYQNQQKNFVDVCVGVHRIWAYCRNSYWKAKDNEYYNSYKLLEKFGFDRKAVSRYNNCYDKFIDGKADNMFRLCAVVEEFSPSKLFELLPLSKETIISLVIQELIKPEMTVKQIREFVKSMKDGTDKKEKVIEDTEINEEEIPDCYDVNKKYEFSYFENKTKNQLLNIVWELHEKYHDLKSKRSKTK